MLSDERCNYQRQQYMDKIKRFVSQNKYWLLIMPAIVGIATSGLYFEHYYLIRLYIETGPTLMLLETSNLGLYIMCFISFAQCIRIKNSLPPQLAVPRVKSQLRNNHPLYIQKNICDKDSSRFKPARTSHCHICGCVTRMDHHCAYINNCVGLRNFKAFLLFTGYGGIFALQFLIMSIFTYFKMVDQQSNKFTEDQTTAWVLLTICSFILTLSMVGLTVSNLLMASKNLTRMDLLKGTFRFNDTEGDHPNPFDLGKFSNFNSIFQKQAWLFWFPTAITLPNDGSQFPMIPPIYNEDINTLFENIREMIKDPIQKSIPNSIEELRQKEMENYKDEYRLNNDKKQNSIVPNVSMEIKQESDKNLDSSSVNILSE